MRYFHRYFKDLDVVISIYISFVEETKSCKIIQNASPIVGKISHDFEFQSGVLFIVYHCVPCWLHYLKLSLSKFK